MDPVVSVIIPNYNHEAFLKQRIESVLTQTFQDFELIILDDFSTDKSRDIIELYRSNPRVKNIIYNDKNSGSPFKQWEKGIQIASGKYIWIAESDDFCHQTFLESAVKALENSDTSLHYCQSYNVDENNNVIDDNFLWTEEIKTIDWRQPFSMNGRDFISKALQFQNVIPNASAVVFLKKELHFTKLHKYKTAGDWLFWIRIAVSSNVGYSSKILNYFRSHSNSTRSKTTHQKFILRHFEVLSVMYELYYKYQVGNETRLNDFLKVCIDISSILDILSFSKFCRDFDLPVNFVIIFFKRKLLVNKYMRKYKLAR